MNNTGSVEITIKEEKLSETESSNVHANCVNQSTNGLEKACKCGAFLIPLCIVI